MDEASLRGLLERALADEPPAGPVVSRSVEAGVRLRRRRRVREAVACAAVVVAAGAVVPALRTSSPQAPASGFAIPPTLYVTADYDGNVAPAGAITPISIGTGKVGRPIEAGQSESIISSPDGRTLYIVSNVSSWVRPVSTVTRTAGPAISVGRGPTAMAITPDGKTLFVVGANFNQGSGWVTRISVAAGKAAPPIQVNPRPDAIVITPGGKIAYVLCTGPLARIGDFTGLGTVTPISVATNRAGRPITVGREPSAMVITPDGKTLYVADAGSGMVTPVSVATNRAGRPITVGREPGAMVITPDGKTLYVADAGSGMVTPVSVATNTAGRPIPAGREPGAMTVTPHGKTLYVADVGSDAVTPITVATDTAGPPITVRSAPSEIVITPDGKRAYVLCIGDGGPQQNGTVMLIMTATDTARRVATIAGASFGQMVLVP